MRFTRWPRDRRRNQRGVSLIEALVASALLGIGVVVGLASWDTAIMGAQKAVRQTWARCMVRSELDAILAAPWADDYTSPDSTIVPVSVSWPSGRAVSGPGAEQKVTVQALDPQSHQLLFGASVLKVYALKGEKVMDPGSVTSSNTGDVTVGCPAP